MSEQHPIACDLLTSAITTFLANKNLADNAVAQLSDDQLRQPLDPNTNSIAVIMKHLSGNLLSRWTDFLTTDGEKPTRDRDQEFVDDFQNRKQILDLWEQGWQRLVDTLQSLEPEQVAAEVTIRGEPHSVALAIQRSLAHCSYHIGQIVLTARLLAKDNWQVLTIPKGESSSYNRNVWGTTSFHDRADPKSD